MSRYGPEKEKKMEFSEEVSHRKNCHRSSIEPPCFRKLPEPIVLEWWVGQSDICKRIWIDSRIFKSLKEELGCLLIEHLMDGTVGMAALKDWVCEVWGKITLSIQRLASCKVCIRLFRLSKQYP